MSKTKKIVLAVAAVIVVAAIVVAVCCFVNRDNGKISLTIEVTHGDGTVKTFEVKTDAENLADALLEEGLIEGHEDTYGLYIDSVDGETASADDNCAWLFTRNGEQVDTGAATTPIADGEQYEFFILTW